MKIWLQCRFSSQYTEKDPVNWVKQMKCYWLLWTPHCLPVYTIVRGCNEPDSDSESELKTLSCIPSLCHKKKEKEKNNSIKTEREHYSKSVFVNAKRLGKIGVSLTPQDAPWVQVGPLVLAMRGLTTRGRFLQSFRHVIFSPFLGQGNQQHPACIWDVCGYFNRGVHKNAVVLWLPVNIIAGNPWKIHCLCPPKISCTDFGTPPSGKGPTCVLGRIMWEGLAFMLQYLHVLQNKTNRQTKIFFKANINITFYN